MNHPFRFDVRDPWTIPGDPTECSDCGGAPDEHQPASLLLDTPEERERLIAAIQEWVGPDRSPPGHERPDHAPELADAIIAALRPKP